MGIAGVNHITLASADLDAATRFYGEVLDFAVVARWPRGAYLVAGDLWLALVSGPAETRRDDYSHVAFHVESHEFARFERRIHASGAPIWQDNWTEGESLYFTDPDGHRLEIHTTTLRARIDAAAADPWEGLTIAETAAEEARPAPSVTDPRKARRLACAPIGVFVVVVDSRDRILFLRHPDTGRLEVPNGSMEPGEDPAVTARRELGEEAGPDLDVGMMRCHTAYNVDYHPHLPPLVSIGFVCRHRGGDAVAGDDMAGWEAVWHGLADVDRSALAIPADPEILRAACAVLAATD